MNTINFEGEALDCADGESVLECLLRHDIKISFSCKMGTCQACLVKAEACDIPVGAQTGLPKNLKAQNYFLSCLFYPDTDIKVSQAKTSSLFKIATVLKKNYLADDVLQLFLEPSGEFEFYAGQFVNIKAVDETVRSYSIASNPNDQTQLELHIKRMNNGKMSNWLFDELLIGDKIEYQGANGNNFYTKDNLDKPMLLIGTGTGLAPLLSIIRYALSEGHQGNIVLYHGTRHSSGLYLNRQLHELANEVKNFFYFACLSGEIEFDGTLHGRANDLALQKHKDLTGWEVFLCGEPEMVKSAQKNVYLAGANLSDIHTDPFNLRDLRRRRRK